MGGNGCFDPHWELLGDHATLPSLTGETELHYQQRVGLYDTRGVQMEDWRDCFLILTNYRILAINQQAITKALVFECITGIRRFIPTYLGKVWSSPKIKLLVHSVAPLNETTSASKAAAGKTQTYLLSFRDGGTEIFDVKLRNAWTARMNSGAGSRQTDAQRAGTSTTTRPALAIGVGHVVDSLTRRQQSNLHVVRTAFTDLGTLEACIQDVFEVVDAMVHNAHPEALETTSDLQDLHRVLHSLGVARDLTTGGNASPDSASLSDSSLGDRKSFVRQLSLDLRAWLDHALPPLGGIVFLHDVYALYNRSAYARHGLISPEDLLKAIECFDDAFHLPFTVKVTPSQAKLLCHSTFKETFLRALHDLLPERYTSCVDAVQLAQHLNISLWAANEMLMDAENDAILCRADTFAGITYYWNIFLYDV